MEAEDLMCRHLSFVDFQPQPFSDRVGLEGRYSLLNMRHGADTPSAGLLFLWGRQIPYVPRQRLSNVISCLRHLDAIVIGCTRINVDWVHFQKVPMR